jgi:hypothetical protein
VAVDDPPPVPDPVGALSSPVSSPLPQADMTAMPAAAPAPPRNMRRFIERTMIFSSHPHGVERTTQMVHTYIARINDQILTLLDIQPVFKQPAR